MSVRSSTASQPQAPATTARFIHIPRNSTECNARAEPSKNAQSTVVKTTKLGVFPVFAVFYCWCAETRHFKTFVASNFSKKKHWQGKPHPQTATIKVFAASNSFRSGKQEYSNAYREKRISIKRVESIKRVPINLDSSSQRNGKLTQLVLKSLWIRLLWEFIHIFVLLKTVSLQFQKNRNSDF